VAVPRAVNEYRIRRLKAMGCNAYRTSHNPPTPDILDLCDRLGMVVMDEVRLPGTSPEFKQQLTSLMQRDRNHPSVVLWSLGNEEMRIQGTATGVKLFKRMQQWAHELDPTRRCTYAMNGDWQKVTDFHEEHGFHLDVHGFNYMIKRNYEAYDIFHKKYPDHPITGSENTGTMSTRGLYAEEISEIPLVIAERWQTSTIWTNPVREGIASAYGEAYPLWGGTPQETWQVAAERPFVAGLFVWTGFDYRGETSPYDWPSVVSRYGMMDLCGFAKDFFYYFQAKWTTDDVLHLLPHWDWQGREGEIIDVWAYSNAERIELFLNGESLGVQDVPLHGHNEWKVPYAPGKVTARGYKHGQWMMEQTVETTTAPTAIRLSSSRVTLDADREDVCVVEVAITDAAGRVSPLANHLVQFSVSGPGTIIGTGNGNPLSHENDKIPKRKAYHGLCQVLVQSTGEAGEIILTATSEGLQAAHLSMQTTDVGEIPHVPSLHAKTEEEQRTKYDADNGI